jgi:signal transduction histidine kinase
MNRVLWLRLLAISVFFALMLTLVDVLLMRALIGSQREDVQRSLYLFVAHLMEEAPYPQSMARIAQLSAESPSMRLELWVVSDSAQVLASNTPAPPPAAILQGPWPAGVHEVSSHGRFFAGDAANALVRLDAATPTYLVVRTPGALGRSTFNMLVLMFVMTLVGAIFLGLFLVMFYLRARSKAATRVIAQLEAGQLHARFQVDPLDALGGLMLNFNRMADEIERLVARLRTNERIRRELLQELGHDLRTPLTSLRTAVETLAVHGERLEAGEREELLAVVGSELAYFTSLIDDLFFIADIDEPRYRKQAQCIDLGEMLAVEIRAAQGVQRVAPVKFELEQLVSQADGARILGDPYLAARLLRNVFDNAGRHAQGLVRARIERAGERVVVTVEDDGGGMSADAMARFGKRRMQREPSMASAIGASLGLGSVIIRTITELHGGQLELASAACALGGMRLRLVFPAAPAP